MDQFRSAYELAVLVGGLGLLTLLVYRGHSIFVAAPGCAAGILLLSGADVLAGMTGNFMAGFADYLRRFYLIFTLGAAFGAVAEESGAAAVIARWVGRGLGPKRACLAVVLACAVLTYGGVSLFVVGFAVYPLAVQLFRVGNLPRRFIPGAIAFGSVTFTMTTAGSPEIQNLIPIDYLVDSESGAKLTDARAGWPASLIVAAVMFGLGQWYLERAIAADLRRGLGWEPRPTDDPPVNPAPAEVGANAPVERTEASLGAATPCSGERGYSTAPTKTTEPSLRAALLPLVLTLLALNVLPWLAAQARQRAARLPNFPENATLAIFVGLAAALVLQRRWLPSISGPLNKGFGNGLAAIGSTCSVVGFGAALKDLPAFNLLVQWVTHLPGDPLIGAAIAVAVIAGIAGSASGGQSLALPIIKPIFVDQLGVAPRALHRVVAIASGSLDSLPANGYLVMLIRNICGDTHERAYGPIFVTTVLIPTIGTALAIALFRWFPEWRYY